MNVMATCVTAADTVVITAECRGCGACLLTCPEHAIRPVPVPGVPVPGVPVRRSSAHGSSARGVAVRGEPVPDTSTEAGLVHLVVLDELCTRCGECIEVCPADAVILNPRDCEVIA